MVGPTKRARTGSAAVRRSSRGRNKVSATNNDFSEEEEEEEEQDHDMEDKPNHELDDNNNDDDDDEDNEVSGHKEEVKNKKTAKPSSQKRKRTTTSSKTKNKTTATTKSPARSSAKTKKTISNRKKKYDRVEDDEDDNDSASVEDLGGETQDTTAIPIERDDDNDNDGSQEQQDSSSETKTMKKKAPKPPKHQVLTERYPLPKLWDAKKAREEKGSYTFKVASWNVAGLRALIKKTPNCLLELVQRHDLDVLCLQETKLQNQHLDDPKQPIRGELLEKYGYDSYYSCSTAKKGYSGTAIYVKRHKKEQQRAINIDVHNDNDNKNDDDGNVDDGDTKNKKKKKQTNLNSFFGASSSKKKGKMQRSSNDGVEQEQEGEIEDDDMQQKENEEDDISSSSWLSSSMIDTLIPRHVSYKMELHKKDGKHDQEGRLITLDFPLFTLCNVYVPNSGQKLERLQYRTTEWDTDFVKYIQQKQKSSINDEEDQEQERCIFWLGDLNIAHHNLDVWNDGAKHLSKQAGVTEEERTSFTNMLNTTGYIDAFRYLHGTDINKLGGQYTYWSQRAGNRIPNKGLRLDYFICSPNMFDDIHDVSDIEQKNDVDDDDDDDNKDPDPTTKNNTNNTNKRGNKSKSKSRVIVRDSYMDHDQQGSDHCPIILEIEITSK